MSVENIDLTDCEELCHRLNLYKIDKPGNIEYDQYDSAIVAASSALEAKHIHPNGMCSNWDTYTDSWCEPDDVEVFFIGKAKQGIKKGVVLASFNAG